MLSRSRGRVDRADSQPLTRRSRPTSDGPAQKRSPRGHGIRIRRRWEPMGSSRFAKPTSRSSTQTIWDGAEMVYLDLRSRVGLSHHPWSHRVETMVETMGLEPTTPCLQMSPRRTRANTWGHEWPDRRARGTSANALGRLGMVHEWCIATSVKPDAERLVHPRQEQPRCPPPLSPSRRGRGAAWTSRLRSWRR